ncbi:hypothetical protein ONS96_012568 [Cadophora gregata f. sp. sojae]|nr:hypothetical protein ONS96_012568 [Cadophora gregata f. sp. sojae]
MEASRFDKKHGHDAYGPFGFLNPTTRHYRLPSQKLIDQKIQENLRNKESGNGEGDRTEDPAKNRGDEIRAGDVERLFRTRDNRKGRHQISISPALHQDVQYLTPPPSNTFRATLHGILLMFTSFPYWDVSYLVAIIFTLGSLDWCVNAFFVWLPLQLPSSEFPGEIANAGGISAFVGATIFEIGSVLLMIEAVNENRSDCFGWAIEEVLEERGLRRLKPDGCVHHHRNKGNLVGKGKTVDGKPPLNVEMASKDKLDFKSARTWTWWPTWYELRIHYFKEVGFLACLSQMIGATIFVSWKRFLAPCRKHHMQFLMMRNEKKLRRCASRVFLTQ